MNARGRMEKLEQSLGDPADPGSPLGFAAILAADERAEMFAEGERALDAYGLNAEFVPPEYGGRLTRLDDLAEIMQSVYRRDPCLGLGYGTSSFIAAVNVWTSADDEHRRTVAGLLLGNRRVASAYHELAHGNDMGRTEFEAMPGRGGLVLNGRKEVVTNIQRADALVMFARTDRRQGSRSHSQILVEKEGLAEGGLRYLPRFPSVGMRGVQLGGVEFRDCLIPGDSVLGTAGHGLEVAMRSFQITRTLLPAMMVGILDTGLRTAVGHALSRRLYGGVAADLPEVRSTLVGAFADLLACDCFGLVCARALHLLPRQTSVLAAAAKYAMSGVMSEAMHRLSIVLGAQSYLREGENGIFQKLMRDLLPVGFGHAARAACQMTILPQLPMLARRSWSTADPAPAGLFRQDADLPPVPFAQLSVTAGGQDSLSAGLAGVLEATSAGADRDERRVRDLAGRFLAELRELTETCADLPPGERTFAAGSDAYDLASRYTAVLMAAACLETWRHNRDDPFLGNPAWLIAALGRHAGRLDGRTPELPEDVEKTLYAELLDRHEKGVSFGLSSRRFAGGSR
ncbi:acyl-CoA dehydrogenase [Streptosporangium carneum]|uniref:Acyl-CoA dehydrogenase n=1 Tax=Streptosporangium carneum TaxID=47481 RepID=A0A9W6MHV0_9ACTN|nr:acyl-CoA dehydrogenase [Streptosporangium carneum]GLK14636.1 acyl-CoA dehydrogenase [Streptosporangium carneum]